MPLPAPAAVEFVVPGITSPPLTMPGAPLKGTVQDLLAAQAPQPAPEDLEKHETTPGDRYEPSLDVLKERLSAEGLIGDRRRPPRPLPFLPRRIGVVTQYKSHSLLRHIQRGWSFLRGEFPGA